jgi:hypothetical protein
MAEDAIQNPYHRPGLGLVSAICFASFQETTALADGVDGLLGDVVIFLTMGVLA